MKKILIATNILTLAVIYFYSCTTSNHSGINGSVLMSDYTNSGFGGLKSRLIVDITKNYKNATYNAFHPSGSASADARTVWFNLDTLKKFLWYVETTSKKNGLTDLKGLGVRIYYARYPISTDYATYDDLTNVNTGFANMHTVFMVPTYFSTDRNYNVEFDPNFITNNKPELLTKLCNDPNQVLTVLRVMSDPSTMTQNHGDLIPPMNADYKGADLLQYADNH
jgi:hypothetical protein